MTKYALITVTHVEREAVNCWSCKYHEAVSGRHLPVCKLGMQRDCIADNYDKWVYEEECAPGIVVSGFCEEADE